MLLRREFLAQGAALLTHQPPATVNVQDFGARGDGLTDDTEALKGAHATGRPVWYPRPSRFYRTSSAISIVADVSSAGATIRCQQDGSLQKSVFIVAQNSKPITITGMVLDGGYVSGSAGEWSMGIALRSARDVSIIGNTISQPYGDCVYVGRYELAEPSSNITIKRNRLLHPRRCCVAVVCAEGVDISGNEISKSNTFVAAIDVEPNPNGFDRTTGVKIRGNSVRTVGAFVSAAKFNGIETSGLEISGNRGRWTEVFSPTRSARVPNPVIVDNDWSP